MVEEHCQQQLQEGLIKKFAEYSEGLSESSDIGATVYPWEKKEAISPLLIEEGSGKEVVEEPQKPILKPLPLGSLLARLEISVSMDISVLAFYGYIGDISVDIFFMNINILKINKNTLKFINILSKSVKMTLIIKYIHCNEFLKLK